MIWVRSASVFHILLVVGHDGGFDIAFQFAKSLGLSLSKLSGTNGIYSFLNVGNLVGPAELLDVVSEANAIRELVVVRRNVYAFRYTCGADCC